MKYSLLLLFTISRLMTLDVVHTEFSNLAGTPNKQWMVTTEEKEDTDVPFPINRRELLYSKKRCLINGKELYERQEADNLNTAVFMNKCNEQFDDLEFVGCKLVAKRHNWTIRVDNYNKNGSINVLNPLKQIEVMDCYRRTKLVCQREISKCVCSDGYRTEDYWQWNVKDESCYIRPTYECKYDFECSEKAICNHFYTPESKEVKTCRCNPEEFEHAYQLNTGNPEYWSCGKSKLEIGNIIILFLLFLLLMQLF